MRRGRLVLLLGSLSLGIVGVVAFLNAAKIAEWYETWRTTPGDLLERTPWGGGDVPSRKDSILAASIEAHDGPLSIRPTQVDWDQVEVEFLRATKTITTLVVHADTPFLVIDDRVLVHVEYPRVSFGGVVIALALDGEREIWRVSLRALGMTSHSKYSNRIWIRRDHPRYLTVFGQESRGRYTEIVDLRSGKSVAHREEPGVIRVDRL